MDAPYYTGSDDTRPDDDYCPDCGSHYTAPCDEGCTWRRLAELDVIAGDDVPLTPREADRLARIAMKVKR